MELYFKDLISTEASLEKLVDDLNIVVQGVDSLAKSVGANLPETAWGEMSQRLARLKEHCRSIKERVVSSARSTDNMLRENPYWFLGAAFLLGLMLGKSARRRRTPLETPGD